MAELNDEARALVEAGKSALRPQAGDRTRVLEALRTRIAHAGGVQHSGKAPASSGTGPGAAAIAGIAIGVALLGGGAFYALRAPQAPAAPSVAAAPAPPPAAAPEPQAAPASPSTPPVIAATVDPPAPESGRAARRQSDRLAEEVAILSRAETELHAGRFASALQVLDEHRRIFPRGTLTQERVAARVRALCALGRVSEAQGDLARLSPGSLHEGRTREACPPSAKK